MDAVEEGKIKNDAVTAAKIRAGQVVKSLNGFKDAVTLSAGANVTLAPSGNGIAISAASVWGLTGTAGTTAGVNFLGTTDNQPLELRVNNMRGLRLEPNASGAPNVIGGASVNSVAPGVVGATIAGGNLNFMGADCSYSTIGGGVNSRIEPNSGGPRSREASRI